jgi:hypothetical protein
MLDALEAGCNALQQRNVELAAALGQVGASAEASVEALAGANVTPMATETPKRRRPAKRKRKPTKARRKTAAKKAPVVLPSAGETGENQVSADAADGDEARKRGKRQALGMSFSKLRAAIQARRTGQRESHEGAPAEQSG